MACRFFSTISASIGTVQPQAVCLVEITDFWTKRVQTDHIEDLVHSKRVLAVVGFESCDWPVVTTKAEPTTHHTELTSKSVPDGVPADLEKSRQVVQTGLIDDSTQISDIRHASTASGPMEDPTHQELSHMVLARRLVADGYFHMPAPSTDMSHHMPLSSYVRND